ncbi:MAG: histidine--tRNA ligase [candidate division Zixibacteria bacterium]|nr:histidine--tRNA ligase [candidate division Zixibacteria bacterium]
MKQIIRVKGTEDILPQDSFLWQFLSEEVRDVMHKYNYREIIVPVFEHTELFARGIGSSTDIVSKEMYTMTDMGGRQITLRPEGTASVVRSYIENSLGSQSPVNKLYYFGPMFRQEKPQKGRNRQFHQFGIEIIGTDSPMADVEGIALNMSILSRLGLNDCKLMINSIGDEECRPRFRKELKSYLNSRLENLCTDCQTRYENNPMRVFDCKKRTCQSQLTGAPVMLDFLNEESKKHFNSVQEGLRSLDIEYSLNKRLVRGLDYYTKTVYEITSDSIGAQDSLSGGGRYDLLVEELGGKPTPAFGFAAGIERIVIAMKKVDNFEAPVTKPDCFIAVQNSKLLTNALVLAEKFRRECISVDIDFAGRSLKAQMREANRLGVKAVVIIGENEVEKGIYTYKDMKSGEQKEYSLDEIPAVR